MDLPTLLILPRLNLLLLAVSRMIRRLSSFEELIIREALFLREVGGFQCGGQAPTRKKTIPVETQC